MADDLLRLQCQRLLQRGVPSPGGANALVDYDLKRNQGGKQ